MNLRKCSICGKPLADYNKSSVCFFHPEHPNFNKELQDRGKKFVGVGHSTPEQDKVTMDYEGELED